MKKLLFIIICSLTFSTYAQMPELRGTWVAWAGADYPTKTEIAQWMDRLAESNINVVYVDVWRYGYPYWRSELFYNKTGKRTDPGLDPGRDILQDMIAEGHRVGIEVEAWFEAGFAACHEDNDDLFDLHPEWFAQTKNGSYNFFSNGGIKYHWFSHCNSEAQQFLIDLAAEVVQNYDIDGIEFDRVRYPALDCGYDSATVALYKSEHNGQEPPENESDPSWIAWRAQKLTDFIADLSNHVDSLNPDVTISNAPLWYGYEQFCQDWPPWINQGHLDLVTPQLYYATNSSYEYRLNIELQKVNNNQLFYPGISTVANSVTTPPGELIAMIETSRAKNLNGHVIWYHFNLLNYLDTLKATVYQDKVNLPYRSSDWRKPAIIVNETDQSVQKSDGWLPYNNIPGYENGCLYTDNSSDQWIKYFADIPETGWYEIYAYIIAFWNGARQAEYTIYQNSDSLNVQVDQNMDGNARWYKLGDLYLEQGQQRKILKLTNQNLGSRILFTDAVMLLNSNRLSGDPTSIGTKKKSPEYPVNFNLKQNYPNPFNAGTVIEFTVNKPGNMILQIVDTSGRIVTTLINDWVEKGMHRVRYPANNLASGVYYYRLKMGDSSKTRKMLILR